ncbi:LacI family DNA-binding transcriptional regulator [Actinoplanes sp. Pm04-4]|uniref:LacI family DNA-binding transcriptional regulator n=1 Tax=Paractinoplanes pyxinae TaxID=2997416 RepID=A0ABT4BAC7_9ACTN|nr:LacI family DNA-binding transcriptional regulator [Actinoplanes pyxinae]MCY1143416.1 LacI family DNA-binding transcriptional regulator [Actinoplanes pyxinae]
MAMKALSKATIYQVAQLAGVSIATVSRALRDSDLVTRETRERVQAAAQELQFTPSRPARSLAEGRHAANGIVFPDLVGPYYAEVVLGYEAAAAALGSSVLILATNGRRDPAAAVRELAGRVDGLTVMGRTIGDDVVAGIASTGLPVVLLARDPVEGVDTVRAGNSNTARALAEHLVGHGHRTITFLGDPDGSPDVAGRYAGVRAGSKGAHLTLVRGKGLDLESGRRAAKSLLKDKPDAVVCANDEVALGVLLAAQEAGLRVPEDLAVTGWDDLLAARFAGLTTVRQPMRELGATAARWLNKRINESATATRRADKRINEGPPVARRPDERDESHEENRTAARRRILATEVVIRGSCGAHEEVHP